MLARTQAAEEWRRRAIAEYRSASIRHSLVGWLLQLGASPTLLHEGIRIIDDELIHAEMAFAVLSETGENVERIDFGAGSLGLGLEPTLSLLENVCEQGVRTFCLGETVAVRLFKRLREQSVPQSGSACIPPAEGGPAKCVYDPNDACTTTFAWCTDGLWELGGYAIDCSSRGGAGGIGGRPPIAEAGAAGEGSSEPDPAIDCPPTLPTFGAYCYKAELRHELSLRLSGNVWLV